MDLDEVLRTTFAAREFVDRPVDDHALHAVLDLARFAPSGGNRQGWHVVVVRDPSVREQLRSLVVPAMRRYVAETLKGVTPWSAVDPPAASQDEVDAAPEPKALLDPIVDAPVVLVVALDLSEVAAFDRGLDRAGVVAGASVYPFVWNILLAARARGLGGTITTYLASAEPAVRELLHIPEHHAVAALIPVGYPKRTVTRLSRKSVAEIATLEAFDGRPLDA